MYGIVIVNQSTGHNEYKIRRFKEEFAPLGLFFDVFINNGTLCEIKNGNIQINLPKADYVIYLDKDIYLAKMLEKSGYRLFNSPDFLKLCDDKNLTLIKCANEGISIVDTIPSPLVYTNTLTASNLIFLDTVIDKLGLPIVMKKVYGSLGEGVYLANTKEELVELYLKYYKNPLLFEKFIETSKGRSLRILVVDQKVVGIIERNGKDDFRSNFGSNTYSKLIKKPEIYIDFAQKIADLLKIEYAGIDLLYGEDDQPILCEINSNAFFEEFEKTTQINIAKLFGEMIKKKCENNE